MLLPWRACFLPAITLVAACAGPESATAESDLDACVTERLAEAHMPGLSACIVARGAVAWCKALTGTDFAAWSREHLMEPLGLSHTSWRLEDFPAEALATPYAWDGAGYTPYAQYTFADYPDGGLRTTAPELARFLAAIAGGGTIDGHRILRAGTVPAMLAVQHPAIAMHQGLGFYHADIGDEDWVGHAGEERGVATEMFFRPSDGLGFVLLMNGDWGSDRGPVSALEAAIIRFGESLPDGAK